MVRRAAVPHDTAVDRWIGAIALVFAAASAAACSSSPNEPAPPEGTTDATVGSPSPGETNDATAAAPSLHDGGAIGDSGGDATALDASPPDGSPPDDASTDVAADASCVGDAALATELAQLDAAMAKARGLRLVGEPTLRDFERRSAAIEDDLAALRAVCSVTLEADLKARIPALATDVSSWLASSPVGVTSAPPSFVLAGDALTYSPTLSATLTAPSFALTTAPSGATVDATTGLVAWSPQLGDKGANAFVLTITSGATTVRQAFTITVTARTVLSTTPITSAAATITITGSGTTLDGTVVQIPAGLVAGSDELVLASLDPAPPGSADVRIVGPALDVSFSSKRRVLDAAFTVELPAPALQLGEEAGRFVWSSADLPGRGHPTTGVWAPAKTTGTGTTSSAAGTFANGATAGKVKTGSVDGFDVWAPPKTAKEEVDALKAALSAARANVLAEGYADPTADGAVVVALASLDGSLGKAPDRQTILIARGLRGAQLLNTVMHELFHVVQFHAPWKLGRGILEYKGGARWWMEATAEHVADKLTNGQGVDGLLDDPKAFVRTPLTTWNRAHEYDAGIFFDYLAKRQGFVMRTFWQSVVLADLMGVDGAGKVLLAHTGQNGQVPYVPFVHAYTTARAASFDVLAVAKESPSYFNIDLATNDLVDPPRPLGPLASYTYKFSVPTGRPAEEHLVVTFPGSGAEGWLYFDDGSPSPFRTLTSSSTAVDLGNKQGKTMWLHAANNSVTASASFGVTAKLMTPPEPRWGWYFGYVFAVFDTPGEGCNAVAASQGGSNVRLTAGGPGTGGPASAWKCTWYWPADDKDHVAWGQWTPWCDEPFVETYDDVAQKPICKWQ